MAETATTLGSDAPADAPGLVVVGWVVTDTLPEPALLALRRAAEALCQELSTTFPQFAWRVPVVFRTDAMAAQPADRPRAEPAALLHLAVKEREAGQWDFAFALTSRDLRTHYGDSAMGAPSRALDCGVVSLARLADGPLEQADADPLAHRVKALALHLFGHLNNLDHTEAAEDYMAEPATPADLDAMTGYGADNRADLGEALARVADARLEETGRSIAPLFYWRAAWANRQDLGDAVLRSAPWQFPFRFSRLTTAALSALLVLSVTAEAWELGARQSGALVTAVSAIVLAGTSLFILLRQNLLLRSRGARLSEQRAAAATAAAVTTLLGMTSVYALLFVVTLLFGWILVPPDLLSAWAPSLETTPRFAHYATMAGLTAALGTIIGALGASFEASNYFRHVIFIDEET